MVIKQLNASTFDVFIGEGWENYLRVKLDHGQRKAVVDTSAEHVEVTPKLLELIYYKIKKQINNNKGK